MLVPVVLFLVAFAARAATAALFGDPAYPDSSYYVDLARELAAGRGLQVDFIWGFVEVGGRLPESGVLPIPSNAHWMPLAAFVQVPFIWLLGPTSLASGLPFWLCAAAVAPVTWWLGRDSGLPASASLAAALLTALPGGVSPYLSQPDNFALFMLLGALALWACARGLRGDRRAFALGGLVVGLAFLSRNDGVLLGVPFAVAFAADLLHRKRVPARAAGHAEAPPAAWPAEGSSKRVAARAAGHAEAASAYPRASRIGWRAALACAGLFLLVAAPWLMRQVSVFGSVSPSAANGCILWITDYRQLYSATAECTPQAFLAQGALPLAASRVGGLISALGIFATMPLLFFLAPFTLLGGWASRRDPAFRPWFIYAVVLFAVNALLFAVHVPYGTFLHSAVALVPHAYLLAVAGIAAAVTEIARRRPSWQAPRATRVFTTMFVAVVLVGAAAGTLVTSRAWGAEREVRRQVSAALAGVPTTDRLMSPDAGNYRYHAGLGGIVTPDDPLPVVEKALRTYDIRWLVLERDHITSSLAPLLAGRERPAWLSAPILVIAGDERAAGGTGATASLTDGPITMAGLPRAALFAVCLDPKDARCSP